MTLSWVFHKLVWGVFLYQVPGRELQHSQEVNGDFFLNLRHNIEFKINLFMYDQAHLSICLSQITIILQTTMKGVHTLKKYCTLNPE